eukprot:1948113-Rhodomonas_salina.2
MPETETVTERVDAGAEGSARSGDRDGRHVGAVLAQDQVHPRRALHAPHPPGPRRCWLPVLPPRLQLCAASRIAWLMVVLRLRVSCACSPIPTTTALAPSTALSLASTPSSHPWRPLANPLDSHALLSSPDPSQRSHLLGRP